MYELHTLKLKVERKFNKTRFVVIISHGRAMANTRGVNWMLK